MTKSVFIGCIAMTAMVVTVKIMSA